MTTLAEPVSERFVLETADWAFYTAVLDKLDQRHVFVTYDRGRLELMSPSFRHDRRGRLAGLLINVLADEFDIPIVGGGSTTFRREDLDRGLEPDECFYVQNVARVLGRNEIDLTSDPPPDLAIEIEISRRLVDRIPIYESLGISELWRDNGEQVSIFVLDTTGRFRQVNQSRSFPQISDAQIGDLLNRAGVMDQTAWVRQVRNWIRTNLRTEK